MGTGKESSGGPLKMMRKAIVLLSGGQDSSTTLFWTRNQFDCMAVSFDYGQRHIIELEAARKIAAFAEITHKIISIGSLFSQVADSALLQPGEILVDHLQQSALPASFVPGRNILFLTLAAAVAFKVGAKHLVTGVCQTDYSGYPDCRDNTIKALQETLSLALDYPLIIHTPMMFLTKAEEVRLGQTLPGCMEALAYSHTCYEGQYPPCGKCPACVSRAKGFTEAGVVDPLIERSKNDFPS